MSRRSSLFIPIWVFLLLKFLFVATGSADTESIVNQEQVYKASYDDVWNATIQALASRGQIIKLVKKDSSIIGFEQDLEESDFWGYVDTSFIRKIGNWDKFRAKINFLIQELSPRETKILINAQFRGWSTPWYFAPGYFKSNGRLEQKYHNEIYAVLP